MKIQYSREDRTFYLADYLIVTLLLLVVLYPLIFVVSASFSDPNAVSAGKVILWPVGFSLEGYKAVFRTRSIGVGYRKSIFYTTVGTLINVVLTAVCGYPVSRRTRPGRRGFTFLFTFSMYFGGGMIASYLNIKNLGLLNTRWVMIIPTAISTYNLIVCRTFFANGIPAEVEEAAIIDGCSTFQVFIRIVLPLSKALIGVMALYYGVAQWNSFFNALIYLSNARDKVPLALVLREILVLNTMKAAMGGSISEELALYYANLANLLKYALIVVSAAPLLIIYPFLQKYFDKGVMLGSIKG